MRTSVPTMSFSFGSFSPLAFSFSAFDGDVRAHHARDRAFVGDRERAVAERMGALDELLRVRRAAQEGEVGEAVELGVGGKHGV